MKVIFTIILFIFDLHKSLFKNIYDLKDFPDVVFSIFYFITFGMKIMRY